MLYFRDLTWLKCNGATLLTAVIRLTHRRREEVEWSMQLRWMAAGVEWQRVRSQKRPQLVLGLSGFKAPEGSWLGLERLNFWSLPPVDADEQEHDRRDREAGFLMVWYHHGLGTELMDVNPILGDHIWRVAARDGRDLTVEMAMLAAGLNPHELPGKPRPVCVTPEGEAIESAEEAEFWRRNSQFYCVEEVPFGMVIVETPRNVRDAEGYALRRAQELIGVPEPEFVEVHDYSTGKEARKLRKKGKPRDVDNDLFVELHFHGEYEE